MDIAVLCYFVFLAEDGIRDFHVTGVQTCALPILTRPRWCISSSWITTPRAQGRRREPPPSGPRNDALPRRDRARRLRPAFAVGDRYRLHRRPARHRREPRVAAL